MLIDIPVYITVEEDNFVDAVDLVCDIMNDTMAVEVLCEGWRFIEDDKIL